jgi:hypothetical protein
MKKASTIFLLILFFFASTGMTCSVHYCGGNIADVSFFGNGTCGCETGDVPDDCCTNRLHSIKIYDQFVKSSQEVSLKQISSQKFAGFPVMRLFFSCEKNNSVLFALHSRPPDSTGPPSLLFHFFRL